MAEERITAWRIVQAQYLDGAEAGRQAFSGEGARRYGGRWNSRGVPVAYTAGSRALALLEIVVHLGAPRLLGRYALVPVTFAPRHVETLEEAPDGWRAHPAPRAVQEAGDAWVTAGDGPVLRVPSVVVPAEPNYLVNPRHRVFGELEVGAPEALDVDERLRG